MTPVNRLGVEGYFIAGAYGHRQDSFDRDKLLLPDLLLEDFSNDLDALFKPAFDALWQASGWERCFG